MEPNAASIARYLVRTPCNEEAARRAEKDGGTPGDHTKADATSMDASIFNDKIVLPRVCVCVEA